jgi:hypothetical protein
LGRLMDSVREEKTKMLIMYMNDWASLIFLPLRSIRPFPSILVIIPLKYFSNYLRKYFPLPWEHFHGDVSMETICDEARFGDS